MNFFWTIDKPIASLSTCHLGVLPWMAILLSLETDLFQQLINIARFIELWMFLRLCVSAYVCAAFNQLEVALQIYCHSLLHTPFNNLYSIHNCLLCENPGYECPLVTKNEKINI